MYKFYITIFILLFYGFVFWCSASESFRQERAKLKYINSKYMKNVVVYTGRKSRHDPYLTNMTGTIVVPFGNNVTVGVTLRLLSGGDFRVNGKVCDNLRKKWMMDFMSEYTNLTLNVCPLPVGTYRYMNMELPPKNMPIPIVDGDYYLYFDLYVTTTKEKILTVELLLHFDVNVKARKG